MALHGEVKVNGVTVASWVARRTAGGTEPDDVNDYDWTFADKVEGSSATVLMNGHLQHRYGDGAVALAAKVFAAVGGS